MRTYLVAQAGSREEREGGAAEFRLVERLTHPGVLRPLHTQEHEYGQFGCFADAPEGAVQFQSERLRSHLAPRPVPALCFD